MIFSGLKGIDLFVVKDGALSGEVSFKLPLWSKNIRFAHKGACSEQRRYEFLGELQGIAAALSESESESLGPGELTLVLACGLPCWCGSFLSPGHTLGPPLTLALRERRP